MFEGTMVARLLGDPGRARAIAVLDPPDVPEYPFADATMTASDAEAREAAGDDAGALDQHRRATQMWQSLGHVFHRGLALLGTARCLSALGRQDDAEGPAEEARQIFQALRAHALAAEASSLAGAASSVG
jgi:hypothetical protein